MQLFTVLLVDIYGKDEQADLSPQDYKELQYLVEIYRAKLQKKRKGNRK
jgi:hypothetical protein